ncbi:MAG: chemotaxis protein CheD [Pseudomonadota bacterium]
MNYVKQGEYAVADDDSEILTAILGSCVAACLYDEEAGVGGMNHILLPHVDESFGADQMRSVNLMELLINAMMKRGASRDRLKGKLFGGARMLDKTGAIGKANAEFAAGFLADEGIPCIASSLGGDQGRRIRFWPASGRARQFLMRREESVPFIEKPIAPPRAAPSAEADIELF